MIVYQAIKKQFQADVDSGDIDRIIKRIVDFVETFLNGRATGAIVKNEW